MTKRTSPQKKIIKAARLAESKDEDNLAFYLTAVARHISAAGQTEVKIESWDEFSAWWNANRSPGLLFSLMDTLGKGHPAIKKLQVINKKHDHLDKELHEVYLMLKGKGGSKGPRPEGSKPERKAETDKDEDEDVEDVDDEPADDECDETEA